MSFGSNSIHANITINRYIRGETLAILRKRVLLAMLQSKGRITNGCTGKLIDWKVKHKRAPLTPFDDSDSITFSRLDQHKTAQLPMRAYVVSQSGTKADKLMCSGKEAIVNKYTQMVKDLIADIRDQFAEQLLNVDGNAAASTNRIHGLESVFSATDNGSSSLVGTNNDTYAGLSTTRGNYGGTWTGTWPDGYGDSHYDFWSPLVVDYGATLAASSGGWSNSTKTWASTCLEALRFASINTERNGSNLDMFLLEKNLFRQLSDALEAKEQIHVQRGQAVQKTSAGFQALNVNGVDVYWEHGLTAGVGYGLCLDELELHSWQDQLFKSNSDFNLESLSDRVAIDFFGNLRIINPRSQCKLVSL